MGGGGKRQSAQTVVYQPAVAAPVVDPTIDPLTGATNTKKKKKVKKTETRFGSRLGEGSYSDTAGISSKALLGE